MTARSDLFGHPRGLTVLFATEMWERVSFYGMRALLVGYLVQYLLQPGQTEQVLFYPQVRAFFESIAGPLGPQAFASMVYSWYLGLIYASPLLGGWIADRFTGQRRIVIFGILLMALGHFMMAFEALLFPALFALVFGVGFFKTNTTAQVGMLYAKDDPRRDSAYSVFYVGINLGAFIAPLICGTLGEKLGWHYGFGAAGVGILIALAVYLWGWRHLPPDTLRKVDDAPRPKLTGAERRSVLALCLLTIPLTLYWACNEQQGDTMAYWSMDHTMRGISIFGWQTEIPWTWFQSLNPLIVFTVTPMLIWYWQRQGAGTASPTRKMAYGCMLMAAANLIMAWAAQDMSVPTHWLWLVAYFLVMTVGEIFVYPVSMSLFSRVSPRAIISLMMAVCFVPLFVGGGFLHGVFAIYWESMDKADFFLMIAAASSVAAALIWAFDRPLRPYLQERA